MCPCCRVWRLCLDRGWLGTYREATLRRIANEFSPQAYALATGPGFHLKTRGATEVTPSPPASFPQGGGGAGLVDEQVRISAQRAPLPACRRCERTKRLSPRRQAAKDRKGEHFWFLRAFRTFAPLRETVCALLRFFDRFAALGSSRFVIGPGLITAGILRPPMVMADSE
jgi:hypothetical protein